MSVNVNSFNPVRFSGKVEAKDFKGILNAGVAGVTGPIQTVASAFTSQTTGSDSFGIVPGVLAAPESVGVGGGLAAAAAANPSGAGLATTGIGCAFATTVGGTTATPIDKALNLNDKEKVNGPIGAVSSTTTAPVGTFESALSTQGVSVSQSSGTAFTVDTGLTAVNAASGPASAAWSGGHPAAASLLIGAAAALPTAIGKTVATVLDRGLKHPS